MSTATQEPPPANVTQQPSATKEKVTSTAEAEKKPDKAAKSAKRPDGEPVTPVNETDKPPEKPKIESFEVPIENGKPTKANDAEVPAPKEHPQKPDDAIKQPPDATKSATNKKAVTEAPQAEIANTNIDTKSTEATTKLDNAPKSARKDSSQKADVVETQQKATLDASAIESREKTKTDGFNEKAPVIAKETADVTSKQEKPTLEQEASKNAVNSAKFLLSAKLDYAGKRPSKKEQSLPADAAKLAETATEKPSGLANAEKLAQSICLIYCGQITKDESTPSWKRPWIHRGTGFLLNIGHEVYGLATSSLVTASFAEHSILKLIFRSTSDPAKISNRYIFRLGEHVKSRVPAQLSIDMNFYEFTVAFKNRLKKDAKPYLPLNTLNRPLAEADKLYLLGFQRKQKMPGVAKFLKESGKIIASGQALDKEFCKVNGKFFVYSAEADRGFSGAPIFDEKGNLVAMHFSGVPKQSFAFSTWRLLQLLMEKIRPPPKNTPGDKKSLLPNRSKSETALNEWSVEKKPLRRAASLSKLGENLKQTGRRERRPNIDDWGKKAGAVAEEPASVATRAKSSVSKRHFGSQTEAPEDLIFSDMDFALMQAQKPSVRGQNARKMLEPPRRYDLSNQATPSPSPTLRVDLTNLEPFEAACRVADGFKKINKFELYIVLPITCHFAGKFKAKQIPRDHDNGDWFVHELSTFNSMLASTVNLRDYADLKKDIEKVIIETAVMYDGNDPDQLAERAQKIYDETRERSKKLNVKCLVTVYCFGDATSTEQKFYETPAIDDTPMFHLAAEYEPSESFGNRVRIYWH